MKKILILPGCSDANRGDQALIWQTVNIAKKVSLDGQFFMTADTNKSVQSKSKGIACIKPILQHPSRKFKNKENISYNKSLIIKWVAVAIGDLFSSAMLLNRITRRLFRKLYSNDKQKTLKIFEECEACFVKGGGFLHSYGKITDIYLIYYHLFHIKLALKLKKPVYVMPNSFGPFKCKGIKHMISKTLKQCKVVTSRESISQKDLETIKVQSILFPDLGFGLPKSTDKVEIIDEIRNKYKNRKLVAITARPYRFDESNNSKNSYSLYINSLIKFSNWLYDNNYLPIFIEHVLSETKHESDAEALKEIITNLDNERYVYIHNANYDCKYLKNIYSKCDYTVGTRFHSVIFSLSENIPSIAITYGGNKGNGIMKDMGLSNYAVDINNINSELLINKFKQLVSNRDNVKEIIDKYVKNTDNDYQKLCNLIKENG